MGQKRLQYLFLKRILGCLLKIPPFHRVFQGNGLLKSLFESLKNYPKEKKNNTPNPSAFLKTDTKSMEMFFLTNEVKTASSLPWHCPNLNFLKDASWNSENPVAHDMNITRCNKNLTGFIPVFVIPAFSLDRKITVPNCNIKPCVTSN